MSIFRDLTPLVEPLSLDEAYLDVTAVVEDDNQPAKIAAALKRRVKDELGFDHIGRHGDNQIHRQDSVRHG